MDDHDAEKAYVQSVEKWKVLCKPVRTQLVSVKQGVKQFLPEAVRVGNRVGGGVVEGGDVRRSQGGVEERHCSVGGAVAILCILQKQIRQVVDISFWKPVGGNDQASEDKEVQRDPYYVVKHTVLQNFSVFCFSVFTSSW